MFVIIYTMDLCNVFQIIIDNFSRWKIIPSINEH